MRTALLGLALDSAAPGPLHRRIAAELRRAILERRLLAGTPLPSSRLMAQELACARGTVLLALEQLIAEGYVTTRPRAGMSVAADLPDDMLAAPAPSARRAVPATPAAESAPGAAFRLGLPDLAMFPYPLWARLLAAEWRRPSRDLTGPTHPFGHAGLRAAIAQHLGAMRGFVCDPADVVVTSGIRQSITLLARLLLQPGDAAWMEDPGFPGIRVALAAAGATPVAVPIDDGGFVPALAEARAPRARLAVVAAGHHFPLGTVLSLQRRLALLGWAERTGGWIVEDDYDGEYRYAGRPLTPLRALDRSDRVAFVGSFSKLLFPALRLSYLVLPRSLRAAAEVAVTAEGGAALLGQGALARFIAEGHFAAHLRRTRRLYAERQAALIAAVRRHLGGLLEVAADPGGMHLVARPPSDSPAWRDEPSIVRAAAAEGVVVAPLSPCYADAPGRPGLLLGYCGTPTEAIAPALLRLRSALIVAASD